MRAVLSRIARRESTTFLEFRGKRCLSRPGDHQAAVIIIRALRRERFAPNLRSTVPARWRKMTKSYCQRGGHFSIPTQRRDARKKSLFILFSSPSFCAGKQVEFCGKFRENCPGESSASFTEMYQSRLRRFLAFVSVSQAGERLRISHARRS